MSSFIRAQIGGALKMQFRRLNTLTAVRCTAGFRFLAKVRFSRNYGSCPLAKLLLPCGLSPKRLHLTLFAIKQLTAAHLKTNTNLLLKFVSHMI